MNFKIGQMVKYETPTGEVHFARIEAEIAPRRYRILVTPDAFRLEVPAGDIAHPGEDAANAARETSAEKWYASGGLREALERTDGKGNSYKVPASGKLLEEGIERT